MNRAVNEMETRAEEQRRQLHQSVGTLRDAIQQKLDVKSNLRQHLPAACAIVSVLGLVVGYSLTDVAFQTRSKRNP